MSVFANPAGNARDAAAAYTRAILAALGDRDPLVSMSEQVPALTALVEGLSDEELHRPEAPGKWSIAQVLQHLADVELVFGFRLRMAVGNDRPTLPGFDQDLWAQRLRYERADVGAALADLAAIRAANQRVIRNLSEEELARVAIHAERGEESARHMINMLAGHDIVHRNQVARIKGSVQGRPRPGVA
jgi:uncharacterized damage-inducible protein DinB